MAEASGYVPAPYEGVSQAPPQVRLIGACGAMEDCIPEIPNGIQKRPPFEWQAQLLTPDSDPITGDDYAAWFDIPRGSPSVDMTLLLNRESGSVKAYLFLTSNWSPIAVTVSSDAQAYLDANSPAPNASLRACTVEDTTFITNRTVPTAAEAATAAARPYEAIIWCKTHGFSRKTFVTVTSASIGGSYTANFHTHSGSNSNDPLAVGTDKLAKALYDGTDPWPGNDDPNLNPLNVLAASGFTVVLDGSLIYLSHATVDFTLSISDDIGGTGVVPIKGSVQRFSDLPAVAQDGFTVKVAQEAAGGKSDYYVQFVASSATNQGTWKEVVAPGSPVGLDPLTMPVGLTTDGSTWTIDTLPWKQRITGNPELSPDPEFLGQAIQTVGWWAGRLALISNGQVNLSASDDPYKFYTTTLATALDSDPIGLLPPADTKALFKDAAIFDERLVAFSDGMQGVVSSGQGATAADTTRMSPLADTEFTDQLRPQSANHKVYYAAKRGRFLTILVMGVDRISGVVVPEDASAAIPQYLDATLDRSATYRTAYFTLYGASGASYMVGHLFRHANGEAVQNAWFRWNLRTGWTLCGMYFKGSHLLCALKAPDDTLHALALDMTPVKLDPDSEQLLTYADLRVSDVQCSGITYDAGTNSTSFTLPYAVEADIKASVRATSPVDPDHVEGYRPKILSAAAHTVILSGDWRDVGLWFGYVYESFFIPTQFYKRGQDGAVEHAGRLTIRRVKAEVARTSYLGAEVVSPGRDQPAVIFQGYHLGNPEPIDAPPVPPFLRGTAEFAFPVGGRSDQSRIRFVNDDLLGFALLGIEWEGDWKPKAQRVT